MEITAVVVRASDSAVLMVPSGLPRVDVTEKFWFPDVEPVLRALPGIDAAVLTCLSEDPMIYLMLSTGAVPEDARWVHDVDDPAVVAARRYLALPPDSPVTPAWTMPDWYDEALPWIAEHVPGPWAQVRSWGLSNVLRVSGRDGDVYFKALAHSSTIRPAHADAALQANETKACRVGGS